MFERAEISMRERIFDCTTLEEVKSKVSEEIARIPWCGERECGLAMEEKVDAGILGIPQGDVGKGKGNCPICNNETTSMAIMARTY